MSFKEKLKKNNYIRKVVKNHKIKKEYKKDSKEFTSNYIENNNSINQVEYSIMLVVHSLEKGFCHETMRLFGETKIIDLVDKLKKYEIYDKDYKSTAAKMGISMLKKWLLTCENNDWSKNDAYYMAKDFIDHIEVYSSNLEVGAHECTRESMEDFLDFNYLEAISTRHSCRNYQSKDIEDDDLEYCIKAAIASPSACNRQMVKIYSIKDFDKKKELSKLIMGLSGFDMATVNFFIVTFDISAFSFYGERNQGYLNAGLFSMNFVNALHFRGIGSCFLQWGNSNSDEINIKKILGIPKNERIAIVIGAGYYPENYLVANSVRKSIDEIYHEL